MRTCLIFLSLALVATSCGGGSDGGSTPSGTTVSVNTLDGVTGVAVDSSFQYTFSSAMNPATVTASSFFIAPTPVSAMTVAKRAIDSAACNTANALAATVSCSGSSCTLAPSAHLQGNIDYSICLTTDVRSYNGTAFERFMAQFSTGSCATGQRAVAIANSTGQTVWVGITAGTVSCLSDANCPTGASGSCIGANAAAGVSGVCGCSGDASRCGSVSTCSTSNNCCYWNLPTLTTSQIHLVDGDQSIICFPAAASGSTIQWSGNIFARTGCNSTGQQCQTGDCGAGSDGICPTGTGGNPPAALFEFTFSNQSDFSTTPGPDYYDISIINGINVGVSAGPVSGTYAAESGNPYSCTAPGSTSAQGSLPACPWTVTPTVNGTDRSTLLRDVAPSAFSGAGSCPNGGTPNSLRYCACTSDADCSAGSLLCGFAMNASASQYTNVCGTHIGWWTADQLCGSSINVSPLGEPLGCATAVTNSDATTSTHTNFFACTQPAGATNPEQAQSCYTDGAAADCCGCATSASSPFVANWPSVLSPNFGGSDNGCYNKNTNWFTVAQPWLVYLKVACPTAYTYPFDDATSTFTCSGSSSVGAPNYTITFLPTN